MLFGHKESVLYTLEEFEGLRKLAEKVFSDDKKLQLLNEIAHPLIMQRLQKKMECIEDDLVFAEIPVLFESKENYAKNFDKIIVVCSFIV